MTKEEKIIITLYTHLSGIDFAEPADVATYLQKHVAGVDNITVENLDDQDFMTKIKNLFYQEFNDVCEKLSIAATVVLSTVTGISFGCCSAVSICEASCSYKHYLLEHASKDDGEAQAFIRMNSDERYSHKNMEKSVIRRLAAPDVEKAINGEPLGFMFDADDCLIPVNEDKHTDEHEMEMSHEECLIIITVFTHSSGLDLVPLEEVVEYVNEQVGEDTDIALSSISDLDDPEILKAVQEELRCKFNNVCHMLRSEERVVLEASTGISFERMDSLYDYQLLNYGKKRSFREYVLERADHSDPDVLKYAKEDSFFRQFEMKDDYSFVQKWARPEIGKIVAGEPLDFIFDGNDQIIEKGHEELVCVKGLPYTYTIRIMDPTHEYHPCRLSDRLSNYFAYPQEFFVCKDVSERIDGTIVYNFNVKLCLDVDSFDCCVELANVDSKVDIGQQIMDAWTCAQPVTAIWEEDNSLSLKAVNEEEAAKIQSFFRTLKNLVENSSET